MFFIVNYRRSAWRHGGLLVIVVSSKSSCSGSSSGQGHNVLCSWARHFTLTVPLSTRNAGGNPAMD